MGGQLHKHTFRKRKQLPPLSFLYMRGICSDGHLIQDKYFVTEDMRGGYFIALPLEIKDGYLQSMFLSEEGY